MDIKQIKESLSKVFSEKKSRIVFWYDTENEFEEIIPTLDLNGITIINLNDVSFLELKIRLELKDKSGRYILYAPYPEPDPEDDWLCDIRLYSQTFHADRASIVLNELKLDNQSMRPYLKERKTFFRSQDRLSRLKKWVNPKDRETELDLKMLAVLTKASHPDIFSVLMKLFDSFCDEKTFNPNEPSKVWTDIQKLELEKSFWQFIATTFGYVSKAPKLTDFLIRILVTDFANTLKTDLPSSIEHFLIQDRSQGMNASVFLSQWRNNISHFQTYNRISKYYSKKLKISELIQIFNPEQLLEVMTFETVEQRIIRVLRDIIINGQYDNFEQVKLHIQRRRDGYWANSAYGYNGKNLVYVAIYQALEIAIDIFKLRKKYDAGINYPSARDMFQNYTEELFRFDQYYRRFNEAADQVEMGGGDILKNLQTTIENCYSEWFMDQISLSWGSFLEQKSEYEKSDHIMQRWSIPQISNQYDFYRSYVSNVLKTSGKNRIFIIISDAFRYEAAEELTRGINSKYRFKATLKTMLGVLPSYTALGMAALLPHESIKFKEEAGDTILIDEMPIASIDQRAALLNKWKGTAIKAENLLAMNMAQGREFVKPYQVVYIYHNQIDAVGDKAVSESKTFGAVRTTLNELDALVRFVINSLNGSHVVITADHGFIYQEKTPDHIDKSVIDEKPAGTIKAKKRFILGKNLGDSEKVLRGNTRATAGTKSDMEFWLPKGTNRFHFAGGARFYHGGAMLQEIVVPVIVIEELRGKKLQKSQVSQVGVSLLGLQNKIVTNIHRFEFIQTDAVSERVQPRTLVVSLRDTENNSISNEEIVTFDSASSSMDDRKKSVMLMLKSGDYDKKQEYYLVLRETDTDIEYYRKPMFIDLAIMGDF